MMFSVLRTILNNEVLRTISLSTEHFENNQLIPLLNYNPFPSFSDSLLVILVSDASTRSLSRLLYHCRLSLVVDVDFTDRLHDSQVTSSMYTYITILHKVLCDMDLGEVKGGGRGKGLWSYSAKAKGVGARGGRRSALDHKRHSGLFRNHELLDHNRGDIDFSRRWRGRRDCSRVDGNLVKTSSQNCKLFRSPQRSSQYPKLSRQNSSCFFLTTSGESCLATRELSSKILALS
ncbi:hypothetical protein KCU99_g305, partial [Aureobasidium melanogenum]